MEMSEWDRKQNTSSVESYSLRIAFNISDMKCGTTKLFLTLTDFLITMFVLTSLNMLGEVVLTLND
jgi:hypothetical protein